MQKIFIVSMLLTSLMLASKQGNATNHSRLFSALCSQEEDFNRVSNVKKLSPQEKPNDSKVNNVGTVPEPEITLGKGYNFYDPLPMFRFEWPAFEEEWRQQHLLPHTDRPVSTMKQGSRGN